MAHQMRATRPRTFTTCQNRHQVSSSNCRHTNARNAGWRVHATMDSASDPDGLRPNDAVEPSSTPQSSDATEKSKLGKDRPSRNTALHTSTSDSSLADMAKNRPALPLMGNMVLATNTTEEGWRKLDGKVNKYPLHRTFTAIGTPGDDFVKAMVAVVESFTGRVHEECVSQRKSSSGKYLSVTIMATVRSPDEVVGIYAEMRKDTRVAYLV